MGLMDAIQAEARVELKTSDLETLMKNQAKAELIFNGIKADVPHRYMREIITGKKEVEEIDQENKDDNPRTEGEERWRKKNMKAKVTSVKEYTWQQLREILAAGQARETFGDDGEITVKVEGIGEVIMNILDYDKDKAAADPEARTMTVQFKDLVLDEMPFDEEGSNKWENSSLRRYLNSQEFLERFEEGFREMIVQVEKDNDNREKTLDTFFILSVDEMKDQEKKYQRFKTERDCVKVDPEQETMWHWTRSASRGYAGNTWCVNSSGYVHSYTVAHSNRFAPTCVIAAI